jgi:large subunit ribosomal protein L5
MRLKDKYKKEVTKQMQEKFSYANVFEIPKIEKVVLNVGMGRHSKEKLYIDNVVKSLTAISGQKPVLTKAKKAISSFKIRQGMIVGACVTIRGDRMYEFLEKLINVTFPRVRDFRGIVEKNVDRSGNLNIGFKEHTPFPEVRADQVDNPFGLEINIATTAKTHEEGLALMKFFGFPFKPADQG